MGIEKMSIAIRAIANPFKVRFWGIIININTLAAIRIKAI
jgi:hypothetical protein